MFFFLQSRILNQNNINVDYFWIPLQGHLTWLCGPYRAGIYIFYIILFFYFLFYVLRCFTTIFCLPIEELTVLCLRHLTGAMSYFLVRHCEHVSAIYICIEHFVLLPNKQWYCVGVVMCERYVSYAIDLYLGKKGVDCADVRSKLKRSCLAKNELDQVVFATVF